MANSTLRNAELSLGTAVAMSDAETRSIGASAESMATSGLTIPSNCHRVLLYASASYRHQKGADPTTTLGQLVESGEPYAVDHNDFADRKFITTGGGDATFIAIYLR